MKYSELYDQALKNSFGAVKRDINEVKAKNSLIDERLKNSFSNIKRDMDSLKKSIEGIKAGKEKPIELDGFNDRLSRIESAVENINEEEINKINSRIDNLKKGLGTIGEKGIGADLFEIRVNKIESDIENIKNDFSKDTGKLGISKDFESDLAMVKSELKALDEAAINKEYFENEINSLKEELDVDSKLKKLENKISEPVIKEVVIEKPVIKEVIKKVPVKTSKKKGEKGAFTKMIDFFAEN